MRVPLVYQHSPGAAGVIFLVRTSSSSSLFDHPLPSADGSSNIDLVPHC